MFGHISYVVYYTKTDNNIRLDGLPGICPGNKLATKKQMLTNHTVQTYAHKLRMVTPKAFMVRMIETRSWELMAQLIHMGEVELVDLGLSSQAC